jgi:hypothetical protein
VSSGDVDLDRLADFVGGALDGTPDADGVRHLVETDPRWRRAHANLVEAMPAVGRDLARLREMDVAMPADVVARLERALASPVRDNNVIDLEERRRRRQRRIMTLGVAAAVVACSVVGVTTFQSMSRRYDNNSPATSAEQQNRSDLGGGGTGATNAQPPAGAAAGIATASGRDYSASSIGSLSTPGPTIAFGAQSGTSDSRNQPGALANAPAGLERLLDIRLRGQCLDAIIREYGGTVTLLDYARYEGSPALMVVLSGTRIASPGRLVVVVGPTCGENNAITDQRFLGRI